MRDSRGNPLSEADVRVNALVDELAKAAVEEHRVPKHMRHEAARRAARVKRVALGIGGKSGEPECERRWSRCGHVH